MSRGYPEHRAPTLFSTHRRHAEQVSASIEDYAVRIAADRAYTIRTEALQHLEFSVRLQTVDGPTFSGAAERCCAVKIAVRIHRQISFRLGPVRAIPGGAE